LKIKLGHKLGANNRLKRRYS